MPKSQPKPESQMLLRELPSVDRVLDVLGEKPGGAAAIRAELQELRRQILADELRGPLPSVDELAGRASEALAARRTAAAAYPRVVNGTGVLLHTGLGRAPLGEAAVDALGALSGGWSLLEVDPQTGDRKHRESLLLEPLLELTGAEAGLVVNNNASALLLGLMAVADGRDVVVSRGEMIEIGGGFRLPELLALSGCPLVEVGATNRTYTRDFADAVTWETGMMLVMHTSNYRIVGFTAAAPLNELVELGSGQGVPVFVDIGSGVLSPQDPSGPLHDEPDARSALAAGADLVCFSGDKLLGGPQAGILVGRADLIARCRRHPLFRAVRPDRLALAALAATLAQHRDDPGAVPVLAALARSRGEHMARAEALSGLLRRQFPGLRCSATDSEASAGSGSAPARPLPSAAVRLIWPGLEPAELARRLRTGTPSIFSKLWGGQVQLDMLGWLPGDDQRLCAALSALPPVVSPISDSSSSNSESTS
ncbi:MAG: L-seryl-tRNA(Ser) seleniumtransferase [Pseudohongiellaceae bacterium]|jgi:L-seryl-tRNA(Ser) seleniumtransferase